MKKSILFLCIALSGCVSYTNQKPSVYQYGLAQTEMQLKYATIESIREVYIQDQKTGVGTGAGAAVGGIIGSNGLSNTKYGMIGGVIGAVAGGIAGQKISESSSIKNAVEIVLKGDDGKLFVVVQESDNQKMSVGDRVKVIGSYGNIRVVR